LLLLLGRRLLPVQQVSSRHMLQQIAEVA